MLWNHKWTFIADEAVGLFGLNCSLISSNFHCFSKSLFDHTKSSILEITFLRVFGTRSSGFQQVIQNDSKWFRKIQNDLKWSKMIYNDLQWFKMIRYDSIWFKMMQNDSKWCKIIQYNQNYLNWFKLIVNDSKWFKMIQNDSKWSNMI